MGHDALFPFVLITFIVWAVWLIAEFFEFLSECVNKWFYRRERKRFKAEIQKGKRPDWVPYHISNDGIIRVDPEDLFHTRTYKQFEDFCKRNGH